MNQMGTDSYPYINPKRLQAAREYRGFSKTELASKVGLSAQAFTNYEQGEDQPKPEKLTALARELGFEVPYFYGDDLHSIPPESITFRSRRSLTARVRRMAVARSKHATDIISPAFRELFKLPDLDLPDFQGEDPERAAELLRTVWHVGEAPIDNLVHLLESKGVEFYWMNIQSPCVDALSYWVNDQPFIFLNGFKEAGERGRFDAAHELGHLVLHRHTQDVQSKEVESEADRFASAFLMPSRQFSREAPTSFLAADFLPLKTRWRVSLQAMVRRSYDLGLISRYVYEQNCRAVSSRGWRTREPDQLPREQSAISFFILERLCNKGVYADQFASRLKLRFSDFFELVPQAVHFSEDPVNLGQRTWPE